MKNFQAAKIPLPKPGFTRNVLTMMTGASVAQAISLLISPILTRLYTPEAFGEYSIYLQIVTIGVVLATLRYENAILFSKLHIEANNIFAGIGLINLAVCFVVALVTFYFIHPLNELLSLSKNSYGLTIVGFAIFLSAIIQSAQFYLNRFRRYKAFTQGKITQVTGTAIASISLSQLGAIGLVFGHLLGNFLGTIVLLLKILRGKTKSFGHSISKTQIQKSLYQHKRFPIFNTWHAFLNTLSAALPVFVLGAYFNPALVGFYALGLRVIQMPIGLITQSFTNVTSEKIYSDYQRKQVDADKIKRNILKALASLLPVLILGMLLAPKIFEIVFGNEWRQAGVYLQIVAPWIFMTLFASPLAFVPQMVNLQSKALRIEVLYFISRTSALLIGGMLHNEHLAIGLFSMVGVIFVGFNLHWYLQILKRMEATA